MEKSREWEQQTLINELSQGRELAKQLKNHLNPSSSHETRKFLVEKILSSYEKALSVLKWGHGFAGDQPRQPTTASGVLDSPSHVPGSSPRSEGSDHDNKDHIDVYKRRKTLPRWTEQVRVCSETGLEGHLDDGYSWRKYGQKDILGATYPRGYYRCTHRNVRGCLATKQVQRSDEDPSIIEITYRGRHTCIQASHLAPALASSQETEKVLPKQNKEPNPQEEKQKQSQQKFIDFGTGFNVKSEELDIRDQIFPSFSFPSTPIGSENLDDYIFSQAMTESNSFMGSFSPAYISPATSESNYFSMSSCQMNSFGMGQNLQTSESDHTDIISAPNSVTNSPIGDLDFSLSPVDFVSNFPFDNPDFFP
nr:WRKY [Loropetalum chinense var. rubrum]